MYFQEEFTTEEKDILYDTISEAICRACYDLDDFDWDITGEVL